MFLLHIQTRGAVENAGRALRGIETVRLTGGIVNGPTTYKAELIDRVIFSRWQNPPTKEDVAAILAQMEEAATSLNTRLIYIGSVSPKSKVPDANERTILNNFLVDARKKCVEQAWLIYEGTDLQHNLQRVIISGVLILTRTFDNFLSVAKSGESIVKDVSTVLKKDAAPIFQLAKERGLVA
ncbi:DofB protein [Myxococcus fulvus 124B02]|nr:DofB protein [Myxococcus fulvus 124B02]